MYTHCYFCKRDEINQELVQPCSCPRLFHKKCLNKMRSINLNLDGLTKCTECNTRYIFRKSGCGCRRYFGMIKYLCRMVRDISILAF